MKRILFLCTGNYYRSRFAEELFNHLAKDKALAWRAALRGLRVRPDGEVNAGPLSPFAEAGLEMRKIAIAEPARFPQQVTMEEIEGAAVIVAVKEKEHRPLLEQLFPGHVARVEFWNIHDVDAAHPMEALAELEGKVRELFSRVERAGTENKK